MILSTRISWMYLRTTNNCQQRPIFLGDNGGRCTQVWLYSQTWAIDHLQTATTYLQRPLFCGPIFLVYSIKVPLNNDHLSTTAIIFGSQGWPLYTGLTVHLNHFKRLVTFSWFEGMLCCCCWLDDIGDSCWNGEL